MRSEADATAPGGAVELWFGGDVQIERGGVDALRPLRIGLKDGAAGMVNVEGPIAECETASVSIVGRASVPGGERTTASNDPWLVSSPELVSALASAGVRVAGIANNHSLDLGTEGFARTVEYLRAADIAPVGGEAGVLRLELGQAEIVITAHDLTAGLPSTLRQELTTARDSGDALICTFHTTGPPSYFPSPVLRGAVDAAIASGARVIVAHGSHTVGPVERRGETIIAWGLGNLAFACDCTDEQDAIVLEVTLEHDGRTHATVLPIEAGLNGEPARLATDPESIFDLLEAIGSRGLVRSGRRAAF